MPNTGLEMTEAALSGCSGGRLLWFNVTTWMWLHQERPAVRMATHRIRVECMHRRIGAPARRDARLPAHLDAPHAHHGRSFWSAPGQPRPLKYAHRTQGMSTRRSNITHSGARLTCVRRGHDVRRHTFFGRRGDRHRRVQRNMSQIVRLLGRRRCLNVPCPNPRSTLRRRQGGASSLAEFDPDHTNVPALTSRHLLPNRDRAAVRSCPIGTEVCRTGSIGS